MLNFISFDDLNYSYSRKMFVPDYKNFKLHTHKAYEIYKVEGLGCWGNTTDAVYDCWNDKLIIDRQTINNIHFDELIGYVRYAAYLNEMNKGYYYKMQKDSTIKVPSNRFVFEGLLKSLN